MCHMDRNSTRLYRIAFGGGAQNFCTISMFFFMNSSFLWRKKDTACKRYFYIIMDLGSGRECSKWVIFLSHFQGWKAPKTIQLILLCTEPLTSEPHFLNYPKSRQTIPRLGPKDSAEAQAPCPPRQEIIQGAISLVKKAGCLLNLTERAGCKRRHFAFNKARQAREQPAV